MISCCCRNNWCCVSTDMQDCHVCQFDRQYFRVGSHTVCQLLKKRLMSIGWKKYAPKIRVRCFETRLWHRGRWWIVGGNSRLSPKVNSKRLHRRFKMNQIQQKLLAAKFWGVHNHLLDSSLPGNQQNQSPKPNNSSPRQCVLSNNWIFQHSK